MFPALSEPRLNLLPPARKFTPSFVLQSWPRLLLKPSCFNSQLWPFSRSQLQPAHPWHNTSPTTLPCSSVWGLRNHCNPQAEPWLLGRGLNQHFMVSMDPASRNLTHPGLVFSLCQLMSCMCLTPSVQMGHLILKPLLPIMILGLLDKPGRGHLSFLGGPRVNLVMMDSEQREIQTLRI